MDGEGLIPDALEDAALESGARVLYCMPSVQNPTGARHVAQASSRAGARRVATQPVHRSKTTPMGFSPRGRSRSRRCVPERTFYLTSLSKSLVPGLRVGLLRTPPGWIDRVVGAVFATTVTVTPLAAAAAVEWIENGTADRVVAWKRDEVRARQQITRGCARRRGHRRAREPARLVAVAAHTGRPTTSRARRASAASSSPRAVNLRSRDTTRRTPFASASARRPSVNR